MKRLLIPIMLLIPMGSYAMTKISSKHITYTDKVSLYHSDSGFVVREGEKFHNVDPMLLDADLKKIDSKNLNSFLASTLIRVIKLNSGEFALRSHVNGLGGGPLTGMLAAWCIRAAMYVPAAVATTGAIAITGPAGAAAAAGATPGYIATTEGAAAAAAIAGYACWFLP